jgi:hypothetical protein
MRSGSRTSASVAVVVAAAGLLGCGGDHDANPGPNPQPAFYLTAANATDLKRQAYDAGARFARSQGPGKSVLVLDFGAARLKHGTHGATLRGGTFFSNEEIGGALQQAARAYEDHHRRGSVTIVYANSNAFLGRPGRGYTAFDEDTAREAGEQQARAVTDLDLSSRQSATVGGDIEPGYDVVAKPEVSIAMAAGANSVSSEPYYDVGTAPCTGGKCTNGWTPRDICEVASGDGRTVLPEIYLDRLIDQPSQWAEIQKTCKIDPFAGVSSSPIGGLSPQQSWQALRGKTSAGVRPVIVVFPG